MKKNQIFFCIVFILIVSEVGFMLKLPTVFRNYDKELHFLFYFYASYLVCFFFAKNKLTNFIFIIFSLIVFGILIEFFQEYSNSFFNMRIHGKFDVEDIKYNLLGLMLFSSLWCFNYVLIKIKKYNRI